MVFLLFMMGQLPFFFKVRAFYGSKGPTAHYKKRSSKKPEKRGSPRSLPLAQNRKLYYNTQQRQRRLLGVGRLACA